MIKKEDVLIFVITKKKIKDFVKLSGDNNLVHLDKSFSEKIGYNNPIVHGAFQVSLVSQSIGKRLVGDGCVVESYNANFILPLYYPNKITLKSKIILWSKDNSSGVAETKIFNEDDQIVTEITTNFLIKKKQKKTLPKITKSIFKKKFLKKNRTMIITGSGSSLSNALMKKYLKSYNLILVSKNKTSLKNISINILKNCRVVFLDLSINGDQLKDKIENVLYPKENIYAAIHCASIFPTKNELNEVTYNEFLREYSVSSYTIIQLSQLLIDNVKNRGRLICIGSNYAFSNNSNKKILLYSLSKQNLINTTKALSLKLAKYKITANSISPDFMISGMNKNLMKGIYNIQIAENPQKRLCNNYDVINIINHLLNKKSDFISGQDIILNGGKL
tara:strand:- start:3837 stop:5006 length:1170 start_codon:yes stop_codon:yes gene_type:complete